jgi:hypothetical protein
MVWGNSPRKRAFGLLPSGGKDERQNKELIKPNKPLPNPLLL